MEQLELQQTEQQILFHTEVNEEKHVFLRVKILRKLPKRTPGIFPHSNQFPCHSVDPNNFSLSKILGLITIRYDNTSPPLMNFIFSF